MSDRPEPNGSVDRRAVRTRYLLAHALMELGAARGLDALQVGELAEAAGVGRSTFYAHFASKQDFLTRSFIDMIAMMERREAAERPDRADLVPSRSLFAHVGEARAFAAEVARSSEYSAMMAAGEARLRSIAEGNLRRLHPQWTDERRRETAVYIAGGFIGLLRWWIESGLIRTPERMQTAFERLACAAHLERVGEDV